MAHSMLVTQATTVLCTQWDQIQPEAPISMSFLACARRKWGHFGGERKGHCDTSRQSKGNIRVLKMLRDKPR